MEPADKTVVVTPQPTLVGAGADVAASVVGGLSAQPIMLLIVVLNAVFAACAAWFLLTQENYRHTERVMLGDLLRVCIGTGPPTAPLP